jgi:hypothetical protein
MGIFHRPPYLGYNYAEHEILVLRIFMFQGPSRAQMKWVFFWIIIFLGATKWEEAHEGAHEA